MKGRAIMESKDEVLAESQDKATDVIDLNEVVGAKSVSECEKEEANK